MRKKSPKSARLYRVHPLALILLAVGAFCFSITAFMAAFPAPPSQNVTRYVPPPGGFYDPPQINGGASSESNGEEGEAAPADSSADPTPEGQLPGMYTVLVTATNDDYNADTIMIARLDTKNGTLNVVSIPRDTKVNASSRSLKKINGAYGASKKKNDPESGINGLREEVASIIGFYPDHYAMVDLNGFVKLVDAVGKVSFNVPYLDPQRAGDINLTIKKGEQKLSGEEALQLMRYRGYSGAGGVLNDDFGRMQMQQEFLKALAKQTLQIKHIFKLNEFISIAEKNLTTDLDLSAMTWCATELMKLDGESISFATLPVSPSANDSYVHVKSEEALTMINEMINPFTRDITAQDVLHITK